MRKEPNHDSSSCENLTLAERSVLEAISEYGNINSVADHLCLSPYTIRAHLRSIRQKLDVRSTIEAVILFMRSAQPERLE